jgi:hypothetical protein
VTEGASVDDCTTCGACCFSPEARYIALFAVDEARMDGAALALTEVVGGRRSMRFSEGRCVALQIDGGYRCAIYTMRPDACRWLQRNSGACQEQIREKRGFAQEAGRSLVTLRAPRSAAGR